MVCSEQLSLFFQKLFLYGCKQWVKRIQKVASVFILETSPRAHPANLSFRIDSFKFRRYMSGKCRKYGAHIKLTFTGYDLFLQCFLCIQPFFRQRPLPIIQVRHTMPRQVSRPCEIVPYFLIRQS